MPDDPKKVGKPDRDRKSQQPHEKGYRKRTGKGSSKSKPKKK